MSGPIAYTDGSCLGNPGPGGWGARIVYPDRTVSEFGGFQSSTTNNQMEMQAIVAALNQLRDQSQLTVRSDSRYVLDGLSKWLQAWKRRGWMTAAGEPVKNQALWRQLDQFMHRGISLQHVRGHSGDPNNERVDDIARAFASGESPLLFQGQLGDRHDPVLESQVSDGRLLAVSRVQRSRRGGSRGAQPKYVSIVRGQVVVDADWPTCSARVRGVSGARYKKVWTRQELAAFCTENDVNIPLDF